MLLSSALSDEVIAAGCLTTSPPLLPLHNDVKPFVGLLVELEAAEETELFDIFEVILL